MPMKQLHNTKEKNSDSWSLSLCIGSQYSCSSQHKFAFSSINVSNIP